jgi:hypothetical protein
MQLLSSLPADPGVNRNSFQSDPFCFHTSRISLKKPSAGASLPESPARSHPLAQVNLSICELPLCLLVVRVITNRSGCEVLAAS